jgi:hypothetical protein
MPVINIHERVLDASIFEIGKLIDGLASANDKLWPHDRWPAMKFDRPLSVGAIGGHGPIRYTEWQLGSDHVRCTISCIL